MTRLRCLECARDGMLVLHPLDDVIELAAFPYVLIKNCSVHNIIYLVPPIEIIALSENSSS